MRNFLKAAVIALAVIIAVTFAFFSAIVAWQISLQYSRFEDRTDPQLGMLIEGIATSDALWILGSSGQVVRINRTSGERSLLSKGTIDIVTDGQHLWALSKTTEGSWQVTDLRNPNEPAIAVSRDTEPIVLFSTSAGPAVLASNKVLLPTSDGWSPLPLGETITDGAKAFSPSDKVLYVGYDYGEFGGGLRQINLNNGQVSIIEDTPDPRQTLQLCQGLMNTRCAPVVGLISDPQQPDCILAGTSQSHLGMYDGVVVRVCGQTLAPVFSRELWTLDKLTSGPNRTWAFNTLTPVRNGWVAVGHTRYARAAYAADSTSPKIKMSAFPRLGNLGNLKVSKDIDGVIFVEAYCCVYYGLKKERWVIALPVVN